MIKVKRAFIWLTCCLSTLALFACRSVVPEPAYIPVEMVFDTPVDEIVKGLRLSPPVHSWDGYGEAIDVHGDVLVVGASEWNYYGPGLAYVYRFSNGEWQEEAQLTASDCDDSVNQAKRFGSSVAVGEGLIAVGAPGHTYWKGLGYAGAVYLFEYDGHTWIETAKLTASHTDVDFAEIEVDWLRSDRMRRRSFGALVALDGDTLAVGGDSGTESVYIFQRGESGWQEAARLLIPGLPERDLYMTSLALLEDTLALSVFYISPQPEDSPILTGNVTVYIFEPVDGAWQESFRFIPEDGNLDLFFFPEINVGASVALGGASGQANLLAIGLPGFPDWSGVQEVSVLYPNMPEFPESKRKAGSVYIFAREENRGWKQQATLMPAGWENPPGLPSGVFSFLFGVPEAEIASAGDPAMTGDEQFFSFSEVFTASFAFPGYLYSEDPEISFFGATVDLDGNQLAVTAGFANATYVFERRGHEWVYRFSVKPSQQQFWEDYAQVVKISGDTLLLGTPGEFGNSAYVFSLSSVAGNR